MEKLMTWTKGLDGELSITFVTELVESINLGFNWNK
jgi:hypothetical protein